MMKRIVFLMFLVQQLTFSSTKDANDHTHLCSCSSSAESPIRFSCIHQDDYAFMAEDLEIKHAVLNFSKGVKNSRAVFSAGASWLNLNMRKKSEISLGFTSSKELWIFSNINVEFRKFVHGPKFALFNLNIRL